MTGAKLRRLARTELTRRERLRRETQRQAFSLEALAGDHRWQLGAMVDRACWLHLMCARQSGKSWACHGILLEQGFRAPDTTNLFLGIKGTGVRISQWPVWKRLCERFGVPDSAHNETLMMTRFDNGACVLFAGTDDLSNVKKYLGNRLDNCVVVVDESQDQTDTVLKYLHRQLLPPMCTPTTRVIFAGVLPDVEAGYFYELAADRPLSEAPELAKSKGWSHHEWGRAANVHTPEAMEQLAAYIKEHNIPEDDPQIQRDWYMRRVWDPNATAYKYNRARNGYVPAAPAWLTDVAGAPLGWGAYSVPVVWYEREPVEAPPGFILAAVPGKGVRYFAVGIDPGSVDRFAIVVWGWGEDSQDVQEVFEWSCPRGSHVTWGQVAPILAAIQRAYAPSYWYYDAGSSQNELDTFQRDYGVPAVKAATKADMPGQVRRNNDLLTKGWLKVMIGGCLEEDYRKARFDPDARARKQWKWHSSWHPDVSEAGRYGAQGYYSAYEPKDPKTKAEKAREAFYSDLDADLDPNEPEPDALSDMLGWRSS